MKANSLSFVSIPESPPGPSLPPCLVLPASVEDSETWVQLLNFLGSGKWKRRLWSSSAVMSESISLKVGKTNQEPENWLSPVIRGDRTVFPEVSEWSCAMPGWCGWMVSHMQPLVRVEEQYDLAFLAYFRHLQAVQFAASVRNGHYSPATRSCGYLSQKPVASLK